MSWSFCFVALQAQQFALSRASTNRYSYNPFISLDVSISTDLSNQLSCSLSCLCLITILFLVVVVFVVELDSD